MTNNETARELFGDWLVMTKNDVLQWDALIEELNAKSNKTKSPIWGFTTSTMKEEENDQQ
jgi:hypothetical protein